MLQLNSLTSSHPFFGCSDCALVRAGTNITRYMQHKTQYNSCSHKPGEEAHPGTSEHRLIQQPKVWTSSGLTACRCFCSMPECQRTLNACAAYSIMPALSEMLQGGNASQGCSAICHVLCQKTCQLAEDALHHSHVRGSQLAINKTCLQFKVQIRTVGKQWVQMRLNEVTRTP